MHEKTEKRVGSANAKLNSCNYDTPSDGSKANFDKHARLRLILVKFK